MSCRRNGLRKQVPEAKAGPVELRRERKKENPLGGRAGEGASMFLRAAWKLFWNVSIKKLYGTSFLSFFLSFFFFILTGDIFSLLLKREERRKRNIDVRGKHRTCPGIVRTGTGEQTRNPGTCPNWKSIECSIFGLLGNAPTNWATLARAMELIFYERIKICVWSYQRKILTLWP